MYSTEDMDRAAGAGVAATRRIDPRLRELYAECWRIGTDPLTPTRSKHLARLWVRVMTTVLEAAYPMPPEGVDAPAAIPAAAVARRRAA